MLENQFFYYKQYAQYRERYFKALGFAIKLIKLFISYFVKV